MAAVRSYVLSIAGFDPSGGAGVLADVKTFEANKVYGLGVISANTFQNDKEFSHVDWIPAEKIKEQVRLLRTRFHIGWVKIGLIENPEVLYELIQYLHASFAGVKIVVDPVMKASAGFSFYDRVNAPLLEKICKEIYLLTPNMPEALSLGAKQDAKENAKQLAQFCHVFLKGGHAETETGKDFLFTTEGKSFSFRPRIKIAGGKHGSGCILSSAIAANLARGFKLHAACMRGKQYTEHVLNSNTTLLAYHKI